MGVGRTDERIIVIQWALLLLAPIRPHGDRSSSIDLSASAANLDN